MDEESDEEDVVAFIGEGGSVALLLKGAKINKYKLLCTNNQFSEKKYRLTKALGTRQWTRVHRSCLELLCRHDKSERTLLVLDPLP